MKYLALLVLAFLLSLGPNSVSGQEPLDKFETLPSLPTDFKFGALSVVPAAKVNWQAEYRWDSGRRTGEVIVSAKVASGYHIYSTTQNPAATLPTVIQLASADCQLTGNWEPSSAPKIARYPAYAVPCEEHSGEISWTAQCSFGPAFNPETASVTVSIAGQVCAHDSSCEQFAEEIPVTYAGELQRTIDREVRPEGTHATWSAHLVPAEAKPGEQVELLIRAQVAPHYHIYPYVAGDPETQNRTLLVASQKGTLRFGTPECDGTTISQDMGGGERLQYYDGSVQWRIPIEIPRDEQPGVKPVELRVAFNTCDERSCDPPAAVGFSGKVVVGAVRGDSVVPLAARSITFADVANHPALATWIDAPVVNPTLAQRLSGAALQPWMLLAALLGGFILNFMPCVLPVVGLKLMSFVGQAGSNHRQIVWLNLSFVAGILAVTLGLAAINVGTKLAGKTLGWGEQFNSLPVQIGIVLLLFSMSLSFLGVWEIPIPGFATGSKANDLMSQGGLSGAFYKGILTTVLATPCSGPLLGAVFGETLKLSALGSIMVFLTVGLGLGLPYLAMCVWPGSLRWLPKPGAWMETLKQVLAFPLLLSMVWFLNVVDSQYHIAVLVLLVGVWFSCWWIGRLPPYAEKQSHYRRWAAAVAVAVLVGMASFRYLGPREHLLPWQPYSPQALADSRAAGKPVLIEFTARWCPTCQTNMRFAIERPEVARLVSQHSVVTLLADWTDTSPNSASANAIRQQVHELNSNSIPLLAVYPADPNRPPIVLRDMISQSQLLSAIEQAVRPVSMTAKSDDLPAYR